MRTALFWVITQRVVVRKCHYWRRKPEIRHNTKLVLNRFRFQNGERIHMI